jgi:signal transduction histidine kinase
LRNLFFGGYEMEKPAATTVQGGSERRWLAQLFPQGQDVISIAGFLMILISLIWIVISHSEVLPAWRFYGAVLGTAAILLIHVFRGRISAAFEPSEKIDLWLLSAMSLLVLAVTWLSQAVTGSAYLVLMIAGSAFFLLPARPALALTAVTAALFLLLTSLGPGATQPAVGQLALALSFGLALVISVGWLVRRNNAQTRRSQALASSLREANQELLARRQHEKQLAVAEERVRLAREIHDGLGHHLTVLNVQLQVAGKLLSHQPDQVADILENCREEAQAALAEVRRSVAVMRQTPLDGRSLPQALEQLVGDFNQHSALRATFQQDGSPGPLSAAASITCYRAAQEGLTNAQKHAQQAQRVQVRLAFQPDGLRLTVLDDGRPAADSPDGLGFGLDGLRERVDHLGGEFQSGPREEGGFAISLWLPRDENHD